MTHIRFKLGRNAGYTQHSLDERRRHRITKSVKNYSHIPHDDLSRQKRRVSSPPTAVYQHCSRIVYIMRIQVRTSINVRSHTAPSTPVFVNEALPENWKDHIIEEKRSASEMPTLVESARTRFVASQRPPQGSRLSAWLHGSSAISSERRLKAIRSHTTTACYSRTPRRVKGERHPPALRHAASTRGVIDPVHSPTTSWPLSNDSFEVMRDRDRQLPTWEPYQDISRGKSVYPQLKTGPQRRGTRNVIVRKKGDRTCLPAVTDPKIRHKIFGCLFFGTILTIVLTTCTSPCLPLSCFHSPSTKLTKHP